MDIFNNYFQKLEKVYAQEFGTLPTLTYTDSINKALLVGDVNEDDEIQWKVIKQDKNIDWKNIEKIIGFAVNEELKEYYSTFYFVTITGSVSNVYFRLFSVGATKDVERDIKQHFADGKYDFSSSQIFLIGECSVGADDSYFVYYDNNSKEVFCYDRETEHKVVLADSLTTLFRIIEVEY